MILLLSIILIISLILEGTVMSLPLVLVCLLCFAIIFRTPMIFLIAFLAGIVLDLFTMRLMGSTSIFFLVFLLLVFLYQRKYELDSLPFVALASFFGSWSYLLLFGYTNALLLAVVNAMIGLLLYKILTIGYRLQTR